MLQNYIRIAFRTLTKNKVYSLINIIGFAIGITCTLLILLWVSDETTYDAWMPKYDRVFRLMTRATYGGSVNVWNANPIPSVEAIKELSTEVVDVAISDWGGDHLLAIGGRADRSGVKRKGHYVNEAFIPMFGNTMLKGDAKTALNDIKSIVLTESTAKMLFGSEDPMDRIVRLDDNDELKVTGVIEDVPSNSSIKFDYLLPFSLFETTPWVKNAKDRWDFHSWPVYIELKDKADAPTVVSKIFDLPAKHGQVDVRKEFFLHPISRWHLYSKFENGNEVGGMIEYVRTFAIIAGLVLFIACVIL